MIGTSQIWTPQVMKTTILVRKVTNTARGKILWRVEVRPATALHGLTKMNLFKKVPPLGRLKKKQTMRTYEWISFFQWKYFLAKAYIKCGKYSVDLKKEKEETALGWNGTVLEKVVRPWRSSLEVQGIYTTWIIVTFHQLFICACVCLPVCMLVLMNAVGGDSPVSLCVAQVGSQNQTQVLCKVNKRC